MAFRSDVPRKPSVVPSLGSFAGADLSHCIGQKILHVGGVLRRRHFLIVSLIDMSIAHTSFAAKLHRAIRICVERTELASP